MPRPRLTFDQAVVRGAAAKDPGRFADRKKSPKAAGTLGDPPTYFKEATKKVWFEIASAIPEGVAGLADRMTVEMAARLLHQFRTEPEMQSSRIAILMNLLSRLGLDPQARTKLRVGGGSKESTEPTDEWSFTKPK